MIFEVLLLDYLYIGFKPCSFLRDDSRQMSSNHSSLRSRIDAYTSYSLSCEHGLIQEIVKERLLLNLYLRYVLKILQQSLKHNRAFKQAFDRNHQNYLLTQLEDQFRECYFS